MPIIGPTEIKNIVIVGAGAMGSLFAGRLFEVGASVTLVDRDASRLQIIGQLGIKLTDDKGTRVLRPNASLAADVSGPVDLVVLFTKGMHSQVATQSVAHLAPQSPLALTLQNGVGNANILAEVFGEDRIVLGTALVPADLVPPNHVISHGFSALRIGSMRPDSRAQAEALGALLEMSGFCTRVEDNVETAVWEKLAFNAALNASAMITGANNDQLHNSHGLRIAHHVLDETLAVASARGLMLNSAEISASIVTGLTQHAAHEASMLQDRKLGRSTEIETINGAIVDEGKRLGIPTPVNETLCDLVRIIEKVEAKT